MAHHTTILQLVSVLGQTIENGIKVMALSYRTSTNSLDNSHGCQDDRTSHNVIETNLSRLMTYGSLLPKHAASLCSKDHHLLMSFKLITHLLNRGQHARAVFLFDGLQLLPPPRYFKMISALRKWTPRSWNTLNLPPVIITVTSLEHFQERSKSLFSTTCTRRLLESGEAASHLRSAILWRHLRINDHGARDTL